MAIIEIENLGFAYATNKERKILQNINLNIEGGSYVTLLGKSGSGKTTLLRHLKKELAPAGPKEGSLKVDGQVGYVMQNPDAQIVTDKVWHELAFGLENLGLEQGIIRTRVAEMASYFGIQSWFYKDVSELSGGQKQLLNLASIMAMRPDILILDEPTAQLDPIAATDFLNTVKKINLELGTTILITEHRLEDILHASDMVVYMEEGTVLYTGDPRMVGQALYEQKRDMFVAMPAPMTIFYGAQMSDKKECPLTVREGRRWLTKLNSNWKIENTSDQKRTESQEDYKSEKITESQGKYKTGKSETAIELKNVWFRYEKDAPDILKGVNLTVEKGSLYALVGGNGSGKSTTLKNICRICRPYRGTIMIDGKKVEKYKSQELFRNHLAMLPQDPQSLFVKQTLREELEEMLGPKLAGDYERKVEIEGFENVPLHEEIKRVAEICEITHLLKQHPYDLSGGEQQRAALAKVLLTNPSIILMDEPTKGLDAFFKITFAEILERLMNRGVTILMVSHDIEFCARYAHRVGMFFDGQVTSENDPVYFFAENSFYTTAANRMARHIFPLAVTSDQVIDNITRFT